MMLTKDSSLAKGLPKTTESLCPECLSIIQATIREDDGKVVMEKTCPQHGSFKDVVWSDAKTYLRVEKWAKDGMGVIDPAIPKAKQCPFDCGLCDLHLSHTALANLDLTNRCNLKCPICFANANSAGYVYEPDYDTVIKMLKLLRSQKPVPCPAVQFSGGEPTIYPHFFKVIKAAREMGFAQVQAATNGIEFAKSLEFCKMASQAGLNTLYLQFDGMRSEIYERARGKDLLATKQKVVDNFRQLPTHPSIVLVPTVVKGVNDDQVWPILDYALKNMDVIRGVNYQPVAFTGRMTREELVEGRYTLTDLIHDVEEQSGGKIKASDWYPVPTVVAVSELVGAIAGKNMVTFTNHTHCGLATYLFVKDNEHIIPLTRFIDVDSLFTELYELAKKASGKKVQLFTKVKAYSLIKKHIKKDQLPEGMNVMEFLNVLKRVFSEDTKKGLSKFSWNMMYVGAMHFMDSYNYDIERVKRCSIHYTTPDMRLIPFCAYNSGPVYRTDVEKRFSIPLDEWRKKHGDQYT
ncbi:MAG: radical SAM protein [Candidatus Thermoplasmatota archaeon]|nr:radical SAM protein [Candidatus Thermoplasmatota archaeon]